MVEKNTLTLATWSDLKPGLSPELIDTLKGLTDVQLAKVVTEVLNSYREQTSTLGYKVMSLVETYESRNILV
jgi:hypothetical protein